MHKISIHAVSVTATGDCGPQRPYEPPSPPHQFIKTVIHLNNHAYACFTV